MQEHSKIETWEQLKGLGADGVAGYMNYYIKQGNTVEEIMQRLGAGSRTGSRFLSKRGYKLVNDEYILVEEKGKSVDRKEQIIEPKTEKPKDKQAKPQTAYEKTKVKPQTVVPNNKKKGTDTTIEIYSDVHNTLTELDVSDYVRTSLSYAKETQMKLDRFLKDKPLLKKQDFITHAIEDAIRKYDSK